MKYERVLGTGLSIVVLTVCLFGCGSSTTEIPAGSRGLLTAVTMWSDASPDDALAKLVTQDDPGQKSSPLPEALTLSETQYVVLSSWERTRVNDQAQGLGQNARALARTALVKAQMEEANGNAADAAKLTEAVRKLGLELSNKRHTKLMQMIGEAILTGVPSS